MDFLLNAAVFAAFYVIALAWHCIFQGGAPTANEHAGFSIFAALAGHAHHLTPALHDAAREFVAHLVVYSGYVIPQH